MKCLLRAAEANDKRAVSKAGVFGRAWGKKMTDKLDATREKTRKGMRSERRGTNSKCQRPNGSKELMRNIDPPEFGSSTARALRSVEARGKPTSGRARPMALSRLVLVDSTGFGWLEAGAQAARGAGLADRGNGTVACISCGGSLVKDGQAKVSILWLLKAALAQGFFGDINGDRPVCCRAIPAHRSVPGREYGSLVQARKEWSVAEAGPSIMDSAGARYGGRSHTLHFQPPVAAEGMEEVVAAAVHAFPARPSDALDVVLCCGWNCDGAMLPLECFAAKTLTDARTWREFVREALTQADEREGWEGTGGK